MFRGMSGPVGRVELVGFPKPVDKGALSQPFQATIEVVAAVSQWLIQLLADLAQIQSFEIKQLKRQALHFWKLLQSSLQLHAVELCADLPLAIRLPPPTIPATPNL